MCVPAHRLRCSQTLVPTAIAATAAISIALAACVDEPMSPTLDDTPRDVSLDPAPAFFHGLAQEELDRLDRESELGYPADASSRSGGMGLGDRDDEMNGIVAVTEPIRRAVLDGTRDAPSEVAARTLDLDIPEVCHRDSPALDFPNGWLFFDDHCDALLAGKDQLRGTVALNWDTATVMTEWDGLILGRFGVERLYLHHRGLDGSLPPELGALDDLEVLSLGRNELTGGIPPELGSMTDLERLYLQDNQLTGEIPVEVGAMRSLERLYLWGNQLTGEIPSQLGSLSSLERLNLGGNQFVGAIPPQLGRLSRLEWLHLWGNELTGPIPNELGRLSRIEQLSLSRNQLTGGIPPELGRLRSLGYLWLYENDLTGSIPSPTTGAWEKLRVLWLHDNQLTGGVPADLQDTDLYSLAVSTNAGLTGPLPLELQALLLDAFYWAGTGLCSPPDPSFQAWLASIDEDSYSGGPVCGSETGNRSPVIVEIIPDTVMTVGDSITGDASDYFSDPDGDTLSYRATSSNTSVATVRLSGSIGTVTAVAEGTATIRVTATDPGGLSAEQSFTVTVGSSAVCTEDLGMISNGTTVTRAASWDGSCRSTHYTNGEYARYYNFTITASLSVRVDLTSPSVDTWLALRRGAGTGGALIESDDDGGTGTNARITRTLAAGTYTIEATTLRGGETGPFTLTLTIGGGGVGGAPDLVVQSPAVNDDTPDAGGSFTFSATVRNRGGGRSGSTTLRYYRSSNATISSGDTEVGTDPVGALAAGGSSPESVSLTAPSQEGTYYYGACVDSVDGESSTNNNCSDGVRVVVSGGGGGGDFQAFSGLRIGDNGSLTLRVGSISLGAGNAHCLDGPVELNGQRYEYHWSAWQRNTGSGWTEVSGSRRTGRLCGYNLTSAPSGRYRVVGDMTLAGVRGMYKSENEVTR